MNSSSVAEVPDLAATAAPAVELTATVPGRGTTLSPPPPPRRICFQPQRFQQRQSMPN
ncbi:hypothetical protein [Parathermosynechococcus lividus]|uniref:hypothetical protein n=1 Tax=Parathermosynechococcus lividus TaxID=33070 RepID=UPI001D0D11B5|nr:hypothetical protein [Thermostichus lividus]